MSSISTSSFASIHDICWSDFERRWGHIPGSNALPPAPSSRVPISVRSAEAAINSIPPADLSPPDFNDDLDDFGGVTLQQPAPAKEEEACLTPSDLRRIDTDFEACKQDALDKHRNDSAKCREEAEGGGLSLESLIPFIIPSRFRIPIPLGKGPKKLPPVGVVPIIGEDDDTADARTRACEIEIDATRDASIGSCSVMRSRARQPKHCGE